MKLSEHTKISIVGVGYVGLPLAVALSKYWHVTCHDVNTERISELKKNFDKTDELSPDELEQAPVQYTNDINDLIDSDVFIVTVPTPVDDNNVPDFSHIESASYSIGKILKSRPVAKPTISEDFLGDTEHRTAVYSDVHEDSSTGSTTKIPDRGRLRNRSNGAIVVYESTVYPGVTENICGRILEKASGLKSGVDFFLGYSPERIDPGNKEKKITDIFKIVSGQTQDVTELLAQMYGKINGNKIHIAPNIATAEAAKMLENIQRDANIALINEVTKVLTKSGISIFDVLDAASTKWNFVSYKPGLVGGHCIGVDPYYFIKLADDLGCSTEIIKAVRTTNEGMSHFIADFVDKVLAAHAFSASLPSERYANCTCNRTVAKPTISEDFLGDTERRTAVCSDAHEDSSTGSTTKIPDRGRLRNSSIAKAESIKQTDPMSRWLVVLGLTFKENVNDFRNTKVVDLVHALVEKGYNVKVHDPYANKNNINFKLDADIIDNDTLMNTKYDCVVLAVPHNFYNESLVNNLLNENGIVVDIKRHLDKNKMKFDCYTL